MGLKSARSTMSEFDWSQIIPRLRQIQSALAGLSAHVQGSGAAGLWPPPYAAAVQRAFASATLAPYGPLLAENAVWEDRATGTPVPARDLLAGPRAKAWEAAFPDGRIETLNLVANEDVIIVERRVTGTHTGELPGDMGGFAPSRRAIDRFVGEVLNVENGRITRINHYHDMAGLLVQLGVMESLPGHHIDMGPGPDVSGLGPFSRGTTVSVGTKNTPEAEANRKALGAVHETFVQHTPERFRELIAEDGIWVDVPVGQVLDGVRAAAEHDLTNWARAFPGSGTEILFTYGNSEWGVVEHIGTGRHEGELRMGDHVLPPTGREVTIRVLDLVQFQGGKAVLIRNHYDMGNLLYQLGLVPGTTGSEGQGGAGQGGEKLGGRPHGGTHGAPH